MNLSDQFQFTASQKRTTFMLMGVGVLTLLIGIIMALSGNHTLQEKVWTGILTNNMFFLGLSLAGLFF
ncbi:MAG: quinol:cytochrome C oxidoreductase, partial [Phototrophicales bacterium]